jgi:hypothetical protein
MLGIGADELTGVMSRLLTLAAWICCGLLLCSFALFANDRLAAGSSHQTAEVLGATAPASPPPRPRPEGQPRRLIDAGAAALRSPFDGLVQSDSAWVRRGLPTLLALIVYGFGLGYLSRLLRVARLRAPGRATYR